MFLLGVSFDVFFRRNVSICDLPASQFWVNCTCLGAGPWLPLFLSMSLDIFLYINTADVKSGSCLKQVNCSVWKLNQYWAHHSADLKSMQTGMLGSTCYRDTLKSSLLDAWPKQWSELIFLKRPPLRWQYTFRGKGSCLFCSHFLMGAPVMRLQNTSR